MKAALTTLALSLTLVAVGAPAAAQVNPDCAPPDMLVLFDVSGSMNAGGKYASAQNALHLVTQSTEADIRYGLMFFPEPGAYPVRCNTGAELAVDLALDNWDAIYRKTSPTLYPGTTPNPEYFGGPRGDYDTPMFQALDHARQIPALADAGRRHYVLLLTDGVQDCCHAGDYDGEIDCNPTLPYTDPNYPVPEEYLENRADLVALVSQMSAAGISTFVVGFGSLVDAVTLDALAQAGGTAIAGCSGTGDCYYQADNGDDLTAALEEIAVLVGVEVCDGMDNDCDGATDEGTALPCESLCGSGVRACSDGTYLPCNAREPVEEVCDRYDNNCDGVTDEGCVCVDGTTQACGSEVGACARGTQTCADGLWGACGNLVGPSPETCDGILDEDCDGVVDEGCACVNGESEACGTDVGACVAGSRICAGGQFGPCEGAVLAALGDTCGDRLDNDCDGEVDEYCECIPGQVQACGSSLGVCEPGHQTCVGGQWEPCLEAKTGGEEFCNLLDDDCDGSIDEEADCLGGSECRCGWCAVACEPDGSCLQGACIEGYCIVDRCPEGWSCDGYGCVEGEGQEVEPDANDDPGIDGGDPAAGCRCGHTGQADATVLLALFTLGLIRLRRLGRPRP